MSWTKSFPAAVLVLAPGSPVEAQDFGATAVVNAPVPATHRQDPTAAGSEVEVQQRVVPGESVQELLYEVPGTRVLQTGARGSFAGVSLRGAELSHTTVLWGTQPLSGPDTGPLDLSVLPLAAIERIEVYRGGAPAWLADGSIGGVVRLLPREEPGREAGFLLGAGSFGQWQTDAHTSVVTPTLSAFASIGATGSGNDFLFLDDNGTRFETDDDRPARRRNADMEQGQGMLHIRGRTPAGQLQLTVLGTSRINGEPGPASAPALNARRHRSRALSVLTLDREGGDRRPWRLQFSIGGGYQRDRFTDRLAEIGLGPEATDDRTLGLFVRGAASIELLPWLELTGVGDLRHDRFEPDDRLARENGEPSTRWTPGWTVESRFHGRLDRVRLELRPSVRLSWSRASLQSRRVGREADREVDDFLPTFRVGGLIAPWSWLALTASVSTGRRVPSILELFGNRGSLVANLSLSPERSVGVDAGVVVRGRWSSLRGVLELRAFRLSLDDLIRYRRTSQFTAVAENVDEASIDGVEAGVRGRLTTHFRWTGAFTWLHTDAGDGRELPFRPPLTFHLRPELHSGQLLGSAVHAALHAEATHTSGNRVDPANLVELPGRTWFAAGGRLGLLHDTLRLTATVRDVFDARGDDLLGFPLPGRRILVTLAYRRPI